MQQSNKINFKGQNIYIGIDVHLKTWHVTILTDYGFKRKHSQPSSATALFEHLTKNYPEGNYYAIYESGFTGFSTYYSLTALGINCVIANAADIPTSQSELLMKTDAVDSEKLARTLRDGSIKNYIYVPERAILDHRGVVRYRGFLQRKLGSSKSRIKHLLHTNGVEIPDCFSRKTTHWSRNFLRWLHEDVKLLSPTRRTLEYQLELVEYLRQEILSITREIRELSRSDKYSKRVNSLLSIPGVGLITAMSLIVELGDINRFRGEKAFAGYLGLIPTCKNSGEKIRTGEMTPRGNKRLRTMLIESSWIAILYDKALAAKYAELRVKMGSQKAIIRIARKLSNRIFSVLKSEKIYEYDRYI